ncbi:polyphosphate polymerase domain-containing protein [Paenibacillus dakarensis]|uniref:polyphosphate polymerase domain-containing protein n=1 Tax=Paenibacillus dakarensis TaxID=1527293 RepID=UPI0006D574BD|nr:polyphosphate polymerase domain-containing protein [Paenibacillus dakarensis]
MHIQGKRLRHEFKYYIHLHEYITLRHKMTSYMGMDEHSINGEGYGIRSLYFDGPHNHSLHDKNNGIFNREKYRIRIYNGSDNRITLERKSKYGDYVNKEAAPISRNEYDAILSGNPEVLSHREIPLIRDFYHALTQRAFRPTAIVDYIREAYVYEQGNVRITFDKKLSAGINTYDLFDTNLVLKEAITEPVTIMEVKFDAFIPFAIRKLLQPAELVRSSISKYVICREVNNNHFKE